ncbi:MAG TPA: 3-oxoacyl-ACP reductase [Flavobacteriales bacterium]|mgnify:CR=1 FL=1|jgi:3-oxoacyl-[acyl-carrier protein] reductase|nr:3-oxoacyl-ACP reductase [Flavobacteriales bacterium]
MKDQIVIVTGGSKGIGRETVILFSRNGAKSIIWDVDEENAKKTIELTNGQAEFQKVDTTNFEEVETAANELMDKYGRIDILINNAGITSDSTLKKMTSEQFRKVLDVNLTGVFNCGKAVGLKMMERNYGRIINTSSVVAHYGNFGQSNYVATKAGLIGMTKTWAKEMGRYNITVNAVAPGFIETEMILTVPEKILESLRGKSPLNRLGKPNEIAEAYYFLASEKAAFITGAVLNVDGGLTL